MTGFRRDKNFRDQRIFLQYLYKFSKQYALNSNLSQIITQAPLALL